MKTGIFMNVQIKWQYSLAIKVLARYFSLFDSFADKVVSNRTGIQLVCSLPLIGVLFKIVSTPRKAKRIPE